MVVELVGEPRVASLEKLGLTGPLVPLQASIGKLPGAIEAAELDWDASAYAADAFAPAAGVRVTEAGRADGQRVVMLEIASVAYNPVAKEVRFYDTLTVNVDFQGPGGISPDEVMASPSSAGADKSAERLPIVAHDSLAGEMAAFVTHKTSLGWAVDLADTSTAGTTAAAIRGYIQSRYANAATRPTAVLLVGDTGQVPQFVGVGDGSPDTDLYYGCMDDGDDWQPEIPVGRFSVTTGAQLADVVDKTIDYETSPSGEWMHRAAFMAGEDNYAIIEGTHDWVIANYMDPLGYTSDRLYTVSQLATTSDVQDALNDGRAFAIYSGHGSQYSWADGPVFTQTNVGDLTNVGMYPFVGSFACNTGDYSFGESFAETWLRAADRGAVNVWASSVTSYWAEDDILERKLFEAIYDDGYSAFGSATMHAKEQYLLYFGATDTTRRYFEMYNLFGDPTVSLVGLAMGITSPSQLPRAYEGEAYEYTLAAANGEGAYAWLLTGGSLPAGLSLEASTGRIHGTPTGGAASNFTVQVTDAAPETDARAFSLSVVSRLETPTPAQLPTAYLDAPYSVTLQSAGGSAPYSWSVAGARYDSDDPEELAVSVSVVIPAGGTSAPFDLVVGDDSDYDGAQTVTVSATAPGMVGGSAAASVGDDEIHHFVFEPVASPQRTGVAFSVTILAVDIHEDTIVLYNGAINLTGAGAGEVVFVDGRWTGQVTIDAADADVILTADDGHRHTGQSNRFDVINAELDHFEWSHVGGATDQVVVDEPFDVTITAVDSQGFPVANFDGVVALGGSGGDAGVTIGTGTSGWEYPMQTYWHDSRTQVIYQSSEVGGASTIAGLALDVAALPGQVLNHWTIRMMHTSLGSYAVDSWETAGWMTVYQNDQFVLSTGWAEFEFATPFPFNGVDNLMIDFSYNNDDFSDDGECRYTDTGQPRTPSYYSDSEFGDPLTWSSAWPPPDTSTSVPNIRLSVATDVAITPTVSGSFVAGTWTGPVTVRDETAGIHLAVDDGGGHTGQSNAFEVGILLPLFADAGADQERADADEDGYETITLDGSGSTGATAYSWAIDGQEITTGVTPQVVLPIGVHVVELTVTGADLATETDQVQIIVAPLGSQGGALSLANPVESEQLQAGQSCRLFWYGGGLQDTFNVWHLGPEGWGCDATGVAAQTGQYDWDATGRLAGWYRLAVEAVQADTWSQAYSPASLHLLPALGAPPAPLTPTGIAKWLSHPVPSPVPVAEAVDGQFKSSPTASGPDSLLPAYVALKDSAWQPLLPQGQGRSGAKAAWPDPPARDLSANAPAPASGSALGLLWGVDLSVLRHPSVFGPMPDGDACVLALVDAS